MMRRRLLGCLAALALTAAAAGCGGARPQSPTTAVTAPVAPVTAPAPAEGPAPAKDAGTAVSSPAAPGNTPATPVSNPTTPGSAPTTPSAPATGGVNPVAVAPAPPPQQVAQVETVNFSTLQRGTYSGVPERKAVLVTDEQAWQSLWKQHTSRVVNGPGAPAIDFSQEAVLAVYMGEQRTGGYSIEVTGITRENGRLTVTVRQSRPGPGTMTTMALTQPFHLVRLPKMPPGSTVDVRWQ